MSNQHSVKKYRCSVCGSLFPEARMSRTTNAHVCLSCEVIRDLGERSTDRGRAEPKQKHQRKRRSSPTMLVAAAFLSGTAAIMLWRTFGSDIDDDGSFASSFPLEVGDDCLDTLAFHVYEEERVSRTQIEAACPPPLRVSDAGGHTFVLAPSSENYGFSAIRISWEPLDLKLLMEDEAPQESAP